MLPCTEDHLLAERNTSQTCTRVYVFMCVRVHGVPRCETTVSCRLAYIWRSLNTQYSIFDRILCTLLAIRLATRWCLHYITWYEIPRCISHRRLSSICPFGTPRHGRKHPRRHQIAAAAAERGSAGRRVVRNRGQQSERNSSELRFRPIAASLRLICLPPSDTYRTPRGSSVCLQPLLFWHHNTSWILRGEVRFDFYVFTDQTYVSFHVIQTCPHSGIPGLLDSAIGGFHACSFAFGQTGAGKTYTCTGPSQSIRLHSDGDGVMGRSLQYLFNKLNSLGVGYKVKMACMEIYHENVYDLSLPEKSTTPLNVREHPEKGFFAEGKSKIRVCQYFMGLSNCTQDASTCKYQLFQRQSMY